MIFSALVLVFVIISILLIVFRGIVFFVINWLIDLYYHVFKKQERVRNYTGRQSYSNQNQSGYNTSYSNTTTGRTSAKKKEKIFSADDGEYVDFEEVKK